MKQLKLNEIASVVHIANRQWWINIETGDPIVRNKGELLMLAITELAEAVQGLRRNLNDDHLPERKMEEVEAADFFIRCLDFCGGFGIEITEPPVRISLTGGNQAEDLLRITSKICDAYLVSEVDCADEMAIAIHGIINYCELYNLDLIGAYHEKMAFNETREDHKHEARLRANGKKF